MIDKIYDIAFDAASSGRPYMVYPKVFGDNRGSFSEVMVGRDILPIQQINRSTSSQYVIRGFHAQKAPFCQSKLVEALNKTIYDIIIDARPDSTSFGLCQAYELDPIKQNKLYVPQGFLHGFVVPKYEEDKSSTQAIFMYYCNNVYDKASEICINPKMYLTKLFETNATHNNKTSKIFSIVEEMFKSNTMVLSDKDLQGQDYEKFMANIIDEYNKTKILWYN